MTVLIIYKLDSDENPVSRLEIGEYIIGRGALLQCDDRRVSRKHGMITVTEDTATITSIHQNPCFYQSANSSTITLLSKDSSVNISDGDKFSLLADQFWFKIKVEKSSDANGDEEKPENSLSDISRTGMNSPSPQISPSSSNKDLIEAEANKNKNNSLNIKSEADHTDVSDPKSVKSEDEEKVKEENEPVLNNGDGEDVTLPKPEQLPSKMCHIMPKKKAESLNVYQNADDAELKSMLFSSDDEAEDTNTTGKTVNGVDVPKNSCPENDNIKEEINSDISENKESSSNTVNLKADDPNAPSTSGTKRKWRDRCWYGLSCYRKNSKHLEEYSHPGDSDFESDPKDDRPTCPYGDACYRRTSNHRQTYKHTRAAVKPPPQKRKKNNTNDTAKKRATKKQYYDESSEDEYDLEDPFLADSGSEYEADSGSDYNDSSDDTDNNTQATETDTKRLLKEAKRFVKGKKKDKNDD